MIFNFNDMHLDLPDFFRHVSDWPNKHEKSAKIMKIFHPVELQVFTQEMSKSEPDGSVFRGVMKLINEETFIPDIMNPSDKFKRNPVTTF